MHNFTVGRTLPDPFKRLSLIRSSPEVREYFNWYTGKEGRKEEAALQRIPRSGHRRGELLEEKQSLGGELIRLISQPLMIRASYEF